MSGWVWLVLILVAAVSAGLAFALEETHRNGDRYEPRTLVIKQPGFYGSMTLAEDRTWGELHPADPVPWEDLQSDDRTGAGDDLDGEQTAAWFASLREDPGPGVDRPPPPGPVQSCGGCAQPAHSCGGCACEPGWCRCPDRCDCSPNQDEWAEHEWLRRNVFTEVMPDDPGRNAQGRAGPLVTSASHDERLADAWDLLDAELAAAAARHGLDQDADVADWLAGRAVTWARLEIGVLT